LTAPPAPQKISGGRKIRYRSRTDEKVEYWSTALLVGSAVAVEEAEVSEPEVEPGSLSSLPVMSSSSSYAVKKEAEPDARRCGGNELR
jgi:hypothetical protein